METKILEFPVKVTTYLFRFKETMFPYLAIAWATIIHLVTVSVSFLIFHQEF